MNITGRKENAGRPLSTADLAAAARRPVGTADDDGDPDRLPVSSSHVESNVEEPELTESGDRAVARAEARAESRDYAGSREFAEARELAEKRGDTLRNNVAAAARDRADLRENSPAGSPGYRGSRPFAQQGDAVDSQSDSVDSRADALNYPDSDGNAEPREAADTRAHTGARQSSQSQQQGHAPREGYAPRGADSQRESLEPLFTPDKAESYRARWTSIQSGFVDDPRQAVRAGDELVAQVMSNLANTFAEERSRVEGQLDQTGDGTTENLRVALRRYRSFFERLLAL
jgi:hypothetical protein